MEDSDLEKIRRARLEQLKAQGGSSTPAANIGQAEQHDQQEENARKGILDQILQPEAADRLGRIRLVKHERATEVENRLIMLAQTGQLRAKVTESQLKELLEAVAEKREHESIVVSRRKVWDADDELDDLLGV
jgi:DNA-binding TFAR19-related protein (PDSD5 family)